MGIAPEHFDVLIIGSGPAGLFTAIYFERLGVENIAIADRHPYPAGGLLNDGKLNFDLHIGIDLHELKLTVEEAMHLIDQVKEIFTAFPECRQVTGSNRDERTEIIGRIAQEHNVRFIAPEQWHWGTDNGKKAVELTEEGKRQYKLFELKTKAQKEITELGGKVYGLICTEKDPVADSKVKASVSRIKKLETQIARFEIKPKAKPGTETKARPKAKTSVQLKAKSIKTAARKPADVTKK